jgi:hypothetical protein
MDELDFPSMALKQRSARETSFWGVWGDWTQASRVRRSSAVTCKAQGMLNTTRACAILLSLSSFNCYTTLETPKILLGRVAGNLTAMLRVSKAENIKESRFGTYWDTEVRIQFVTLTANKKQDGAAKGKKRFFPAS